MTKAIHEIKTQIWRFGIRVKDHSGIAGYNLMVAGKWRVKVIQSTEVDTVVTGGCDVVAIYTGGERPNKFYALPEPAYDTNNGTQVFKTWTKSPRKIFK